MGAEFASEPSPRASAHQLRLEWFISFMHIMYKKPTQNSFLAS
jgi:hypothetical protein